MRRVQSPALVGASRDEVWRLYDDLRGAPGWMPGVRGIEYVSGPAGLGTVYRERTTGLAGLFGGTRQWEIVEHRPLVRQVRLSRGGAMERRLVIRLEGRGTGTRVRQAVELRSALWGPVGWLHEQLAAIPAAWWVRATVSEVKRTFEGEGPR